MYSKKTEDLNLLVFSMITAQVFVEECKCKFVNK